ncbi:MAG: sigma-70 family RNA polymerase sigma factor [Spirochaetales bacterium]|nr:sigma-70 family RNA polymerase sigma factor [Spirochaetales bacterium]
MNDDEQDVKSIQAVLNGERNAFTSIVSRYTKVLFSLSYHMTGNREEAEEAVQEIFILIFRKLHKYNQEKRFYTWMFTVAVNYLKTLVRKSNRFSPNPDLQFDDSLQYELNTLQESSPENDLIRRESGKALQSALNRLPLKYRSVFILREVEGISIKETAAILRIPENTVKTLSRRGKDELKKIIVSLEWN